MRRVSARVAALHSFGLVLAIVALAALATPTQADETVGSLSDARAVLTRFMDARMDRQDAVWLGLLTDRARTAPPDTLGPTGQISNPCWYRYEVLAFVPQAPGSVAATARIYQHFWPGDVIDGPPASWLQDARLVWTNAGWRIDDLGPMQDYRSEPNEPHGAHTSACYAGRRPGVWLVAATRLPASGGVPSFGRLMVLACGVALIASGLLLRRHRAEDACPRA